MNESKLESLGAEPIAYGVGKTTLWNRSWQDIYDKFGDAIRASARQGGLNEHSQDDVVQEVMAALIQVQLGQQPGYDPQKTTFHKWFWGVIHNRIRSVRRKDRKLILTPPVGEPGESEQNQPRPTEIAVPPPNIGEMEEDEWRQALLAAAMRKMQQRASARNFAIFTALINKEATPEELAGKYGMKRNAIDQVKARCQTILLEEASILHQAWKDLR